MTNKFEFLVRYLGHYKYLLIVIIGILMVGVFSESSTLSLIQLKSQKKDLQDEVDEFREQDNRANRELDALKKSPDMAEKVARERYFMKKDNEDIFVIETDVPDDNYKKKKTEDE